MKKRNFTQQLFSQIVNDKVLSRKGISIFIGILIIIGVIGVLLAKSTLEDVDDLGGYNYFTPKYNIDVLESIGYSIPEINDMDDDTLYNIANPIILKTTNQIAGDVWNGELSKSESNDIKMKFYQYALNDNYTQIIKDYESLISTSYLSESYNKKLIRIYNDAYIINSVLSNPDNTEQLVSTLNNINDERMLLSLFLNSNLKARNNVLKDRLSLTIDKEYHKLNINSISSSSVSYALAKELNIEDANFNKMIKSLDNNDYIVYKINFSINTDTFNAYMYKNLDTLTMSIYGIYEDKITSDMIYLTVVESEEILANVDRYNQSIKNDSENVSNSINEDVNINSTTNEDIIDDLYNEDINTDDIITEGTYCIQISY